MAVIGNVMTTESHFELFNVPGGKFIDRSIVPRGMLHVFGRDDIAAKLAGDQSFCQGTFIFPTDYSYRLSWLSVQQWWEDNITWPNASDQGRVLWSNCLPYSQGSGGGKSNQVSQTLLTKGEIIDLSGGTTKYTRIVWDHPAWSQVIYGDSGGSSDPQFQFMVNNSSTSGDGTSTVYLNAAFHVYDLEQVHNYPVNAPFTAVVV